MQILTLLFLLVFNSLSATAEESRFKIVIDPGHGGTDLGATRDSFVESKIVFEISQKVKEQLLKKNFTDVHLTRENDVLIPLKDRIKLANDLQADLFISLHANTSTSSQLTGMEFYFNASSLSAKKNKTQNSLTNAQVIEQIKSDFKHYEKTKQSLLLSKTVQAASAATVEKSVIKRAPYFVIENTEMPSILIELGFISNRREAKKLAHPDYQTEVAKIIAEALLAYKEKSDKAL
jgi:N-acetylmuramoyl-L-alanine amidase